jgi:hypothetical protein
VAFGTLDGKYLIAPLQSWNWSTLRAAAYTGRDASERLMMPHKSNQNLIDSGAFGAFSPASDLRVVVCR